MSEWREVEIGDICQVGDGAHSKVERVKVGVLYLTAKNFDRGNLKLDKVDYITEEDYERLFSIKSKSIRRPQTNDVLMGIIGSFGNAYRYKEDDHFGISSSVALLRPKTEEVFPLFLEYQINSYRFRKIHESYSSGSVQGYSNIPTIKSMPLLLPSIEEQKEIAKTLSNLDKKITLLRQQNQTLEELAQTLFKRWFVEFEFPFDFAQGKPDENGRPYKSSGGKMVESELGEIPEGWRVGCLVDEFTILMGQSPAGSSYNENKEGKVFYQGRTDFGFRFPTNRLYTKEPNRIASKFDVLVSVRAPVGDVNMASEECCIGRGLAAVKSDLKSYCFNKVKSLKKAFDVFENEGTVFGSLSKNDFNSLEVIVPEKQITEKYDQVAFKLDLKIFENTNEIQTLTQLRDTLLPKLMSGEVRINL